MFILLLRVREYGVRRRPVVQVTVVVNVEGTMLHLMPLATVAVGGV